MAATLMDQPRLAAHGQSLKLASGPSCRTVGASRRSRSRLRTSTGLLCGRPREHTSDAAVARYYDPTTAQFLTRDPLEDRTGQPYSYANDDPLDQSDPSGLCGHWYDVACQAQSGWNNTGGVVVHVVATHTIGQCINFNAAFGIGGSGETCVALVGGKPTVLGNLEGGGGTPGVSLTGGLLISNAHDPSQLRGIFGQGGVSVGEGIVAGDQAAVGNDACGNTIWTNEVNAGLGLYGPLPFQIFGGISNTWTWSL